MPTTLPKSLPTRSRRWNQQRIARWLLLLLILLSAWFIPPILERNQAIAVGINWAPDKQHQIIIYEAPKTFGNGNTKAAHIVLQDHQGKELKRLRLPHIQELKDITWHQHSVTVNGREWPR